MRIGIPDLISNSYFPIIAAVELGFLRDEGIHAEIELIFPVTDAAQALRSGRIDLLGGAAHAPLYAYPRWQGVKLLAALSQNMYWFLVVRRDLGIGKGELARLQGLSIGAAPGVGDGLAQLLTDAGLAPEEAGIRIAPVPGADSSSISFGVTAAQALRDRRIDGFWANGMAAEIAVSSGDGTVVVDARRDGGSPTGFTFAALSASDRLIDESPEKIEGVVRALVRTQMALRDDPSLATQAAGRVFPELETGLIADIVARDTPFYDPIIRDSAVSSVNDFARRIGLDPGDTAYGDVVSELGLSELSTGMDTEEG